MDLEGGRRVRDNSNLIMIECPSQFHVKCVEFASRRGQIIERNPSRIFETTIGVDLENFLI